MRLSLAVDDLQDFKMLSHILFLVLAGSASAFLFSSGSQGDWDGLKVTWGPNPLNSNNFASMPRTASDAVSKGFKKISDCDVNANWRGSRYIKDNDYALVLLYDVNGYIAGIQTTIPSGKADGYPKPSIQPPFVKDGDNFVLSAYFVQPDIICTTGRSADDFKTQGTGTNLYIQNGTVAEKDSIMIPHKEAAIGSTKWTKGKCFYTMGLHYWFNTSEDMSCDNFFPMFILYNGGELNAFGWAMGTQVTSKHIEHPTKSTFPLFMDPVPKCLNDYAAFSTMHIYLTDSATADLC